MVLTSKKYSLSTSSSLSPTKPSSARSCLAPSAESLSIPPIRLAILLTIFSGSRTAGSRRNCSVMLLAFSSTISSPTSLVTAALSLPLSSRAITLLPAMRIALLPMR